MYQVCLLSPYTKKGMGVRQSKLLRIDDFAMDFFSYTPVSLHFTFFHPYIVDGITPRIIYHTICRGLLLSFPVLIVCREISVFALPFYILRIKQPPHVLPSRNHVRLLFPLPPYSFVVQER
jgi:hypothetical protein